eukprot:4353052-Pleurochrysis_carterae.AAC.1
MLRGESQAVPGWTCLASKRRKDGVGKSRGKVSEKESSGEKRGIPPASKKFELFCGLRVAGQ